MIQLVLSRFEKFDRKNVARVYAFNMISVIFHKSVLYHRKIDINISKYFFFLLCFFFCFFFNIYSNYKINVSFFFPFIIY